MGNLQNTTMKIFTYISVAAMLMLVSCGRVPHVQGENDKMTEAQQHLLDEGWDFANPNGGELDEAYGVHPVYGIQDNYFDIVIGEGCSVAIKIVNASTDKCIRYVYVPENETVTVSQIPQGLYYLKLAYGRDWMEQKTDTMVHGKFTRGVFYERSTNSYDFGKKNSQDFVTYRLEINVVDGLVENNFHTEQITEEEFEKN